MIVVRPVRFTDHVESMRTFLTGLGLVPRIESTGGSWVDLCGVQGLVAVHDAATSDGGFASGETRLSFECLDAELLTKTLQHNGFGDATVVDEAYGRVVQLADPDGGLLVIDEVQTDLYGYHQHDEDRPSAVRVTPVRFTAQPAQVGRLLTALGLSGDDGGTDSWQSFSADGSIGVHRHDDTRTDLAFATSEPLEALATRLIMQGFADARVAQEDFGSVVLVTDPDGHDVVITHC